MKFCLKPIETIDRIEYSNAVYDLSIADDHSYTLADGTVVHNCETRLKTGIGVPQITAIQNVRKGLDSVPYGKKMKIISDGGIRYPGDVAKAIAAGADFVMSGRLFAGTIETPGPILRVGPAYNEKIYKEYRGSASNGSKLARGESGNAEGASKLVPLQDSAENVYKMIGEGLKSAMSYVGAETLSEFQSVAELKQVSHASSIEATTHFLSEK